MLNSYCGRTRCCGSGHTKSTSARVSCARAAVKIKIQEKPFQILAALLERPGEVVTREELHRRLWPPDTFVDFDGSLNAATNKLREALGDSADNPRFVETLPRRGYRFIAPVEKTVPAASAAAVGSGASPGLTPSTKGGAAPLENTPPMKPAAEGVATRRRANRYTTRFWLTLCAVGAAAVASYLLPRFWEPSTPPPPSGRIMLGVLPFENYTGDPKQQYFVGGLTEEVIAQLGRLNPQRLGVIARTSTAAFRASARPIVQMGQELGIDYALEGSVRRENERVRITVQMIDVRDRTHSWVENYEQELGGILELQTEIAGFISRSLALKLLDDDIPRAGAANTTNAAAYEAYLKGRYFREQITERGFRKGIEYFERAIGEDPALRSGLLRISRLLLSTGWTRNGSRASQRRSATGKGGGAAGVGTRRLPRRGPRCTRHDRPKIRLELNPHFQFDSDLSTFRRP